MARIISASVAGAVVYYIWGMLTWMVLPLHGPTIQEMPAEQSIIDSIQAQNLESGVYIAPFAIDPASMSDPSSEFVKKHQAGPILSIFLRREGAEPMSAGMLLGGFVIDLLAAGVAVLMLLSLGPCGNNYWCRVGFVAGLGIFVAIVGHLSYWNWMYFPLDFTIAFVIDVAVGWGAGRACNCSASTPRAAEIIRGADRQCFCGLCRKGQASRKSGAGR